MRTGVPCNENMFFPVRIYYTGKTLFWPCTGPVLTLYGIAVHYNGVCLRTWEHDTIWTIENSIGNIRTFSSGTSGFLDHGFKHLGSANNGFSSLVALSNHLFLGNKYFFSWNLNTWNSDRNQLNEIHTYHDSLFQQVKDTFYHRDSISRDKAYCQ